MQSYLRFTGAEFWSFGLVSVCLGVDIARRFLRWGVTVVEIPYPVGDFLAIVVYVVGFLEDCSGLLGALQTFKGIYRCRILDI